MGFPCKLLHFYPFEERDILSLSKLFFIGTRESIFLYRLSGFPGQGLQEVAEDQRDRKFHGV